MAEKELTPTQKIEQLISQAEPLIDQVNNLYNQFATGVERLAPVQKRSQLEALINQLQATPKTNETYRFRVQSLVSRYSSMKDRWDRLLKDIDSGKVKRITGPLAKK
jgi:DNA repair exonuclease SbcCD ATPase subunit